MQPSSSNKQLNILEPPLYRQQRALPKPLAPKQCLQPRDHRLDPVPSLWHVLDLSYLLLSLSPWPGIPHRAPGMGTPWPPTACLQAEVFILDSILQALAYSWRELGVSQFLWDLSALLTWYLPSIFSVLCAAWGFFLLFPPHWGQIQLWMETSCFL